MIAAYNQLLRAHVLAYNALHDLYEARGWPRRVSLSTTIAAIFIGRTKCCWIWSALRERGVARADVSAHIIQRALRV